MSEKRVPARFYQSEIGNEPVRKWIKKLDVLERKIVGVDIKTVEDGWPSGTIARVLFCIYEDEMILLHGFVKKTQKTPVQDLNLALKRKRTLEAEDD
jgi:phage-related protein